MGLGWQYHYDQRVSSWHNSCPLALSLCLKVNGFILGCYEGKGLTAAFQLYGKHSHAAFSCSCQKNTVTVCSTLLWCLVAFTATFIFSSALSLPKLVSWYSLVVAKTEDRKVYHNEQFMWCCQLSSWVLFLDTTTSFPNSAWNLYFKNISYFNLWVSECV